MDMRNQLILIAVLAAVSACAARPASSTFQSKLNRYTCVETELIREGDKLTISEAMADGPMTTTNLGFTDDAGAHYVSFPTSPTDVMAVEYVIPHDHRADAIQRVYDTSRGTSRVDWKLTRQRGCRVDGGYTDAFTRWAAGDSYDQVASDLALDDGSEARELVHKALRRANRRYYRP